MTTPAPRNLIPGQMQLGNMIMGPYSPYSIEELNPMNYDINNQDYQVQGSNELNFGQDTLKPQPIQMKINIRINKLHEVMAAITQDPRALELNFDSDQDLLDTIQYEWRAIETLSAWGALKPLFFCANDGITRQFFGRPGKFHYDRQFIEGSQYYVCTAEYRRSDTFGHSILEYYDATIAKETLKTIKPGGNAQPWVRMILYGPMDHPIINFGSRQFQLDYTIEADDAVEISSYPWERRVVNAAGYSLSPYLIADSPYLDQIQLDDKAGTDISWNASDTTTDSKFVILWYNAYQVMK